MYTVSLPKEQKSLQVKDLELTEKSLTPSSAFLRPPTWKHREDNWVWSREIEIISSSKVQKEPIAVS